MPLTDVGQRGLVVELLGGIGDLVFMLPALDALTRCHPRTRWDVLTFAPGGELLQNDPRVHDVFVARRGSDPEAAHPACWYDLEALLESGDYDLVVSDTRHSEIHRLIEADPGRRNVTQLWSGATVSEPIARTFLRRLREERLIDAFEPGSRCLYLDAEARREAAKAWNALELRPRDTVMLNPHAGVRIKRWPKESFVALGRAIVADGWSVAVLEGEAGPLAAEIAADIPAARVVPRQPLRVAAAGLEHLALLVSGDSGLAHVASAVGTPVLALYGPTWSGRYGVSAPSRNLQSPVACPELNPMNFTRQRCWSADRCIFSDKATCCADISPELALTAARELLAGARVASAGRGMRA